MKIAFVIGTLGRGGSERQIVEFVRAAHPRRASCTVICLGRDGPLAADVREVGASVIALGGRRLATPAVVLRLARALRRERPDVVYAMLFWGYGLALPLAALMAPSACRVQGRRSLPDADAPRRRLHNCLRTLANLCAHGAIANSLGVAAAVAASEPALAGRIWVVPNGIGAFEQARPPAEGPVRIVCVANLIPYKGHATLLGALRRLRPDGWQALLVGEGPEREALEGAIAAGGMRERVMLLGDREDVHELLSRSHLAVLPSHSEGLPNAAMEAMAHGLPVVASDVGGVRSLLGSGAGVLVSPGDERELAEALERLIADPVARAEMGRTGRELARSLLSVEAMRDGTLRALADIRRCRRREPALSS